MAQLFLIKDPRTFERSERIPPSDGGRVCYVFSSSGLPLEKWLSQAVLEPLKGRSYEGQSADRFIKDYIDLIAKLNHQYGRHLLWWATDLSSKNRYTSELPDNIQELVEILSTLSRYKDQPILIVDHSAAIEVSLRKVLASLGMEVHWRVPIGKAWLECAVTGTERMVRILGSAVKYYGRAVYARLFLKKYFRDKVNKAHRYYVIKTFSYSSSWDEQGKYHDTMFGRLPEFLSHKDVFIWTIDLSNFRVLIKRILGGKGPFLLPVEFFLSFKDFVSAVWRVLSFRIPIKDPLFFEGVDVTDMVRYNLAKTLNGIQLIHYLHYAATKNLAGAIPIETFLLSYENNPWERMCTLAIRKADPATKVLGYEHSVVPQASLNMFVSSDDKSIVPMPDKILTTGRIPMELIKKHGDYSDIEVTAACALRYEYLFNIARMPRGFNKRILIVLDGVRQTRQLVDYILKEIGGLPDYHFIFRAHPMLPWFSLAARYGYRLDHVRNVSISNKSLPQELKDADIVIYWQSTVALEALSLGKPLINFSPPSLLSYDPLYGFSSFKSVVGPEDPLARALEKIYALPDEEFNAQYQKAKDHIGQYFYPVNRERLCAFGV